MTIEKQESPVGFGRLITKQRSSQTDDDELCSRLPQTFNSLGSPACSSTNATVITNDDNEEEKETLERKKKKLRLGSWWDNVESFNELSCVVKRLPEAKENDAASSVDYSRLSSSTDLHETKMKTDDQQSLSNQNNLSEDESFTIGESTRSSDKGYRHVTLEELGVTVEDLKSIPWEAFDPTWEIRAETMDPWLGGYVKDMRSPHH
ncbi:hypothetical protein EUTSA_v10019582mg [Eutrema salsugineum]|uniref:Uncharacterized protein n=1 Tax=Eutrema salsugineum TaxID=72664 RepID=V4K9T7_EUTSA|nr:hypothetical protein EUTSA_v10019582mg [Eutrema salsugineum]